MQRPNYSKAPIIEAVIDLRVTPVEGFEVEQFDALREQLQSDYPQFSFIETEQVEFRFEQEFTAQHNKRKNGVLLSSEGNTRLFQARLDGFTFSQRAPYDKWEPFRDEARRLWNIYRSFYPASEITRVAHRAINQLNIVAEPGFELNKYLHTLPSASPEFPRGQMSGFFLQLQLWQPDLECSVVVNQAMVPPPEPEVVSILLDFDLFQARPEEPWDIQQDENAWDLLEKLHVRRNEMFQASLTDDMKEQLR